MKSTYVPLLLLLCLSYSHADSPLTGHVICLDPGHGVIDFEGRIINPGKSSRNAKFLEHRIALEIAQKLGALLKEEGAKVVLTRTPIDYWRQAYTAVDDNKARALLANELKADVYISIHCDWDPRSRVRGVTTYYETNASCRLGEKIHKSLVQTLKAENRHLRRDTYTVLDLALMPAVIVETGFLSNRSEAKKIASDEYQIKIARAITAGLRSYFAN